jgi:peptidoglycan hydrolase-like protein with peptidoglycan-binding domain
VAFYPTPYYGYPYYGNPYYGAPYGGNAYYGNTSHGYTYGTVTQAVQSALARRGYYRGAIDGVLGPETHNAIRAFQAQRGLAVTGQISKNLIQALQT